MLLNINSQHENLHVYKITIVLSTLYFTFASIWIKYIKNLNVTLEINFVHTIYSLKYTKKILLCVKIKINLRYKFTGIKISWKTTFTMHFILFSLKCLHFSLQRYLYWCHLVCTVIQLHLPPWQERYFSFLHTASILLACWWGHPRYPFLFCNQSTYSLLFKQKGTDKVLSL